MNIIRIVRSLGILVPTMLVVAHAQALTGTVIDTTGAAVTGALVQLVNARMADTTASDGTWSITIPSSIEPSMRRSILPVPRFRGTTLYFAVSGQNVPVRASLYTVGGRLLYHSVDRTLGSGFYHLDPLRPSLSTGVYVLRFSMDETTGWYQLAVTGRRSVVPGGNLTRNTTPGNNAGIGKMAVVIDTVKVSKTGYNPAAITIGSYLEGPLTITLKASVSSYHLNPPNPCYNQFYVKNCVPGDPNSACGGNCRVANACSPPEDPNKANLPKTFICPRFMLYSSEMLQAAKDDAALYGWGSGEPPFNYGVVGHDPDVGGVDDGPSSCCQCYQIVYVTPEPSSPKPPDLPYPKPLIVQSCNTAASGPKGFDVFMAAGGYGAFNACYNDPAFGNTTKFNEFMYDQYPYQNPGSGGISFLRYQECIQGWPPTTAGVLSAACQDKIGQMCNQLASLYHQNWEVMVKRVRCPENLTRVTGCRLKEPNLPLPLPAVQTPSQAQASGAFKTGYHTTTMQDCCKPTCAWADWTVGYNLPVDGEWNSFYSCDKNGKPITK